MRRFAPLVFLLALSGCGGDGERRQPAIGEAYIGPATLKLRKDIPLDSPVAANARHGDRVEIVARRRRFSAYHHRADDAAQQVFMIASR